jgi:hypothetical protein
VQFKKVATSERLTSHGLLIQFGLNLIYISGIVEMWKSRLPALDALAQKTRLDVVQLPLEHEPDGLSSGEVARLS